MTPRPPNQSLQRPQEEAQAAWAQRRRHARGQHHSGQDVIVRFLDRPADLPVLTAKLWDFSYGGVGLDISDRLDVGQEIEMAANLVNSEYSLGFEARGRVVHCRPIGKDHYRVGVAFLDVQYRRIEADAPAPTGI